MMCTIFKNKKALLKINKNVQCNVLCFGNLMLKLECTQTENIWTKGDQINNIFKLGSTSTELSNIFQSRNG